LKKALVKLGVRNRTQAVAQAIRLQLPLTVPMGYGPWFLNGSHWSRSAAPSELTPHPLDLPGLAASVIDLSALTPTVLSGHLAEPRARGPRSRWLPYYRRW
jgi:hypothetical protein